jgi:hypothetical protein
MALWERTARDRRALVLVYDKSRGEQLIWVSGRVETRSGLQSSYAAAEPVLVKIRPRVTRVSDAKAPGVVAGAK